MKQENNKVEFISFRAPAGTKAAIAAAAERNTRSKSAQALLYLKQGLELERAKNQHELG